MNTLITSFTGGQPIYMDDFKYIQEAYIEGINAIAKGFNLDSQVSFRVTGADWYVTGAGGATPLLTVNPGYIYVEYGTDKGVYKVDSFTTILPNGAAEAFVEANFSWDISRTYLQPDGTKLFLDGNTHDVYNVEKAVFTQTPTTWSGVKLLKSLDEMITTRINTPTYKKVVNISGWDMNSFPEIYVSHGLDMNKIRNISVYLKSDSDAGVVRNYMLPAFDPTNANPVCFISQVTQGSVVLARISGSFFATSSDFNDGNENRGFVVIEYVA